MFFRTNFLGKEINSTNFREKKVETFEERYPIFYKLFANQIKQNENGNFQGEFKEIDTKDFDFPGDSVFDSSDFYEETSKIQEKKYGFNISQNQFLQKNQKEEEIGFTFTKSLPSSSFALILSTTKCGKSQKSLLRKDIYNLIREKNNGIHIEKILKVEDDIKN